MMPNGSIASHQQAVADQQQQNLQRTHADSVSMDDFGGY